VQPGDRGQPFVGPQHGQLHDRGDARGLGHPDQVEFLTGLVRAHRAEQEDRLDPVQRR
jgi:hypothetical protein